MTALETIVSSYLARALPPQPDNAVLAALAAEARAQAMGYTGRDSLTEGMMPAVVRLMALGVARLGTEGLTAASAGDVKQVFATGLPFEVKVMLAPHRRGRTL